MNVRTLKTPPVVVFLLLFLSCNGLFSQSKLPDTWPADMELKITYGGGMRYYSSETVIRLDGGYILINEEGVEKKTALHFTQQELDKLLKVLKTNKFDLIRSEPRMGIVYDMGTTSTLLTWGNRVSGVSIGASTFLPDKYTKQFQAVDAYIDSLLALKAK
jgi:hypothetical protein